MDQGRFNPAAGGATRSDRASAAGGESDKQIAQALKVHPRTAALWRRRALVEGIACIWEIATGRGRKPKFGATTVSEWIDTTLQTKPRGASHWSTRSLAKTVGVSKNTIHRVWQDHQLKPHSTKSFKLSRDPHFVEKLTDVVGLYLQPPEDAVVLCVDEKSQIQALDRTQPGLPLKRGRCGTFTHDYTRHGTTCLLPRYTLAKAASWLSATLATATRSFCASFAASKRSFPLRAACT